jgi:hypothetical protein
MILTKTILYGLIVKVMSSNQLTPIAYRVYQRRKEREMSKVKGFNIYDRETGQKLATLPLTIPIGSTVEAYEKAGHKVRWGWDEGDDE